MNTYRVLVFQGRVKLLAFLLEHDLGAQGDSLEELAQRLPRAIRAEVSLAGRFGKEPFKRLPVTPRRIRDAWGAAETLSGDEWRETATALLQCCSPDGVELAVRRALTSPHSTGGGDDAWESKPPAKPSRQPAPPNQPATLHHRAPDGRGSARRWRVDERG